MSTATDLGAVELVTIAEAAALLAVKPWAVYRRAESGALGQVYRDGARLLVERGQVIGHEHRVLSLRGVENARWPL